ncbi:MAG: hypothetical protein ACRC5R_04790, partial [Mycoplasmatales bacterium]
IVTSYFKAIEKGNFEKAKDYIITEDATNLEEFKAEDIKENEVIYSAFKKIKVKASDEIIENDSATLRISLTGISISEVIKTTTASVMEKALSSIESGVNIDENQIQELTNQTLKDEIDKAVLSERNGVIKLKNVDGKWKIINSEELQGLLFG